MLWKLEICGWALFHARIDCERFISAIWVSTVAANRLTKHILGCIGSMERNRRKFKFQKLSIQTDTDFFRGSSLDFRLTKMILISLNNALGSAEHILNGTDFRSQNSQAQSAGTVVSQEAGSSSAKPSNEIEANFSFGN